MAVAHALKSAPEFLSPARFEAREAFDRAAPVKLDPSPTLEGRVGVDDVNGCGRRRATDKACRGIDLQGGADHDDDVGRLHEVHRGVDHGDRLPEPYNVGPELSAVGAEIPEGEFGAGQVDNDAGIAGRAGLADFAVQVKHLRAAGPLVQVVNVLGDDVNVEQLFETGQREVTFVGTGLDDLPTALVVKFQDELRMGGEAFWRCDFLNTMAFPETAGAAKCRDPGFSAHPCPT